MTDSVRRPYLVFLVVAVAVNLWILRHFLVTLATAASIVVLLSPLFERLATYLGGRRSLAAGLATAVIALVILVPLSGYVAVLARQAVGIYQSLHLPATPGELSELWSRDLPERYPWLRSIQEKLGTASFDEAIALVVPALANVASGVNRVLQSTLTGVTFALLHLILFLLAMFFLLRDGRHFAAEVVGLMPFSEAERDEMLGSVGRTVKGVLYSMVVVPLAQGLLAIVGFWLFGLPSPFFWGTVLILSAPIPGFGAPLVWVPAALYVLFAVSFWKGIGLVLYGTLVISLIDNVIKPLLLHGTARIHTFLAFLSLVGGLLTFGPPGFLLGPVALSLLQSMARLRQVRQGSS
jgi:predicted PurR-regulated permease PerM